MDWKCYFSKVVLDEIRKRASIWVNPSFMLFVNTSDFGAIQLNHTDLSRRYKEIEPYSETMRWILNYDWGQDCWDMDKEYKEKEETIERRIQIFWKFDYYFDFPERM